MTTVSLRIEPINLRAASEQEYAALHKFDNCMRHERLPNDPPQSLEEAIKNWQGIPPFIELNNWVVWRDSDIIASGGGGFTREDTNQHILFGSIEVLPALRQQAIACRLLAKLVEAAQRENRRLLLGETYSTVPAGEAFMKRLGGKMGLAEHLNQLELAGLNRDLVNKWIRQAQASAHDFELGLWDGAYPKEDLPAISALFDVMNTAPRDELEMEDWKTTPERLRQFEDSIKIRGFERWTMYVRHQPSGELAGFTETVWNPHRPEILEQYGTGVWPQYRNHGLGRWLKAAMIEKVLRDRPQVTRIRTGNAFSNAPMLKINHELGFKPYMSQLNWQVEVEKVRAYLNNTKEPA